MIWKAYKYLYYRIYRWNRDMWKGFSDGPEYNALLGVFILLLFNISAVISFVGSLFEYKSVFDPGPPKSLVVVFNLISLTILYFLFVSNSKYKQIEKEFSTESKALHIRHGYYVVAYVVGSVFMFFLSGFVILFMQR